MLRVEQEVVRVRDTGIGAVRTVHDELIVLQRQPPADLDRPPVDSQLRGDHDRLRADFDSTTSSLRTNLHNLATDVHSKLRTAESAIAQRLDASDQRSQTFLFRPAATASAG